MGGKGRNRRGSAMLVRLLALSVLVFALIFAPIAASGDADAAEPRAPSSMNANGGHDHGSHAEAGHGFVHCSSFSCSPSYIAGFFFGPVSCPIPSWSRMMAGDDPSLRSLNPDCDPPVPRGGFFPA